ncbi:hypothetical protein [Ralstonia sp. SET104]|nr:hypothetical protein [Ralstonia sp. SET104]
MLLPRYEQDDLFAPSKKKLKRRFPESEVTPYRAGQGACTRRLEH